MNETNLEFLLKLYIDGTITPQQQLALAELIHEPGSETTLAKVLEEIWNEFEPGADFSIDDPNALLAQIRDEANKANGELNGHQHFHLRVKTMLAIAAVVVLATSVLLLYLYLPPRPTVKPVIAHQSPLPRGPVLKLSNGSSILLDDAKNGNLARQDHTDINKLSNGTLRYEGATASGKIVYNELQVPRGSRVATIVLCDSTKVWLNAGSSLKFPVPFGNHERRVSITGEAYFEVAHDASRPFRVDQDSHEIEVLGTHFNVNGFADEQEVKVLLLQGAVSVRTNRSRQNLRPGQMALIDASDSVMVSNRADPEQVIAWTKGRFVYQGASIQTIMSEIGRWYDLDVKYTGNIKDHFFLETTRSDDVSKVLHVLEATGAVHLELSGHTVTVRN